MVKQNLSAFASGLLFGFGLCFSRMVDPAVVVSFVDVTGTWDPRLLLVMAGALVVAAVAFPFILKRCRMPVCDKEFYVPSKRGIDGKLILGAVLFGVGWGLGGVCPGPAVTALSFGIKGAFIFFVAMAAGMAVFDRLPSVR